MSNDLIKRSDAIKVVWGEDINPSEDGVVFEAQSHIDRDIRLIPTADRPQGEWIPCSERLPKIGQKVLASTKKTVFTQVFKGYYSEPNNWMWKHNSVKTIEAWMPLPKPWKGAGDDD